MSYERKNDTSSIKQVSAGIARKLIEFILYLIGA